MLNASDETCVKEATPPSTPIARKLSIKAVCPPCHWGLILVTVILAFASIPMIYSASQAIALDNHGNTDFFLIRQIGFVLVGLAAMIVRRACR